MFLVDLFLSVAISVDEIKALFEETGKETNTHSNTLSTFEFGVYMLQVHPLCVSQFMGTSLCIKCSQSHLNLYNVCPLYQSLIVTSMCMCIRFHAHTHTHTCTHIQSVTVPLQGFLNALVYGWTREDFLRVIVRKREGIYSVDSFRSNDIDVNSPLLQSADDEVFLANNSELISSRSMDEQEEFDRGPLYTLPEDSETEHEREEDEQN